MKRDEYLAISAEFGRLTRSKWPHGWCCQKVRHGAPECCYQIVDGAELTFTTAEIAVLRLPAVRQREDGMWVLDRRHWTPRQIGTSLHKGILADVIECRSHPTRPVVEHGTVVDVVAVAGCNRDVGWEAYQAYASQFRRLWQEVVWALGVKPYYGVPHLVKSSWRSLYEV